MDQTLTLNDGRKLSCAVHGPDEAPLLIFCHGAPNSRKFLPPQPPEGVRIATFDRPGYGGSDRAPALGVADIGHDIAALADALGAARFAVAGVSAGGPYALAAAAAAPERVSAVTLVSSIAPLDAPGATRGMNRTNRFAFFLARRAPWALRHALSGMARKAVKDPAGLLDASGGDFAAPDRAVMARPEIRRMYLEDLPEAYAQGPAGHADDLRRLARPWGFRLDAVRAPVEIWQGGADRNVPAAMADRLAGALPDATLRREPDLGHLLLFDRWDRIVARAAELRQVA